MLQSAELLLQAVRAWLPQLSDLYAHARGAGICGLSGDEACMFKTEGIALFLAIEELAKHEPELAFVVAYEHLCRSVASLLLEEEDVRRQAIRHISGPHFLFNTLLIWPNQKPGASMTRTLSELDLQRKLLKIEDPLLPLPSAEDIFFRGGGGWAHSGPKTAAAFWISALYGQKCIDRPVRCLGLNEISFRQIAWNVRLDDGFVAPIGDFAK